MNGASNQFLTCASFTCYENSRIGGSNFFMRNNTPFKAGEAPTICSTSKRDPRSVPQRYIFLLKLIFSAFRISANAFSNSSRASTCSVTSIVVPDKLNKISIFVQNRVSNRVLVLDCSIRKNDSVFGFRTSSLAYAFFKQISNPPSIFADEFGSNAALSIGCVLIRLNPISSKYFG